MPQEFIKKGPDADTLPANQADGVLKRNAANNGWEQVPAGGANGIATTDGSSQVPAAQAPAKAVYATGGGQAIVPADIGVGTWGTFTPTVTGDAPPTFTTNTGRYARAGSLIFVEVDLVESTGGTPGGAPGNQINVALPVAAGASQTANNFWVGIAKNGGTQFQLMGKIAGGASTIALSRWNTINALTLLGASDMSHATSREIRLKFFYEAA